MFGIAHLGTYIFTCLVLILLPGPNSMLCMSISAQHGYRLARYAIAGTFLGNATLLGCSAIGLGTLLQTYPFLLHSFKIIGGAYLAYLGLKLCFSAWQIWQHPQPLASAPLSQHTTDAKAIDLFYKALAVALLNPKALLFFPSMMIQFIDANTTQPAFSFFILASIFQTISLIYLNLISPLSAKISHFFMQNQFLSILGKSIIGTLFCGFACKIWFG